MRRWRVFLRAYRIWQKLGFLPWRKPGKEKKQKRGGDFYRGAFNSIPFLNDDAKRTFSHLLLRPGYMIRDYIRGEHERYLAPLTALIIFYAFFALVSAVLQPVQHKSFARSLVERMDAKEIKLDPEDAEALEELRITVHPSDSARAPFRAGQAENILQNAAYLMKTGYIYLRLDQFPDEVDTRHESAIAAVENTLRSQGIPLFLGKFFLLWLAMGIALRRYHLGMPACAATAAYILCQFSFCMLFVVLFTFGQSTSLSATVMLLILTIDLKQLLGISYRASFRRAIAVGIHYGLIFLTFLMLVSLTILTVAYFQN